MRNATTMLQ